MQTQNNTPFQPMAATGGAGNWYQTTSNFLGDALNKWVQVEQIRQVRSSTGQDQLTKQLNPDLENGAAVQVDKVNDPSGAKTQADGIMINKTMLYGSIALLGVALVLKYK